MRKQIERLYEVFSRYSRPDKLVGCPCCTSEADAEPMLTKPLRSIEADEISRYGGKAITTWGSVEAYKYFLPRIIELIENEKLYLDIERTLGKCKQGHFDSWPSDEKQAIREYVLSAWRRRVQAMDTWNAESYLVCAALLFEDLREFFEYADAEKPGFRSVLSEGHNLGGEQLVNAFWDRDTANYRSVLEWIRKEPPE